MENLPQISQSRESVEVTIKPAIKQEEVYKNGAINAEIASICHCTDLVVYPVRGLACLTRYSNRMLQGFLQ